ncbi:hypothetical protein [Shinella sp.]|uniref:hypothetical protein n=1 Tax=Shinella sp. TaxID=1870904 RepID=UPI0025910E04|nr:hypothetical protein [Shinella sp.]MCW5707765.1 hypothetical protein [Shinella sp.]
MVVLLRMALIALAISWTPADRAFAEPASFPDLADSVAGRKDLTFADLIRLVVPRIAANGEASSGDGAIDVRHIGGEAWSSAGPEATELLKLAALPARSGGLDRMVLLLDFGQARDSASGFAVLALFDVTGEPRLLDAADVAFDRWTSFAEPGRLAVGEGDDLLVTRSTHSNSSQGYATTALVLLREDRFELIDRISTLDDRACAFERTQRLDIQQGTGAPFADMEATVTERTAGSGEQCGDATAPEPGTRTIAVTYRWDDAGQRYIADSDAFAALARENEERF